MVKVTQKDGSVLSYDADWIEHKDGSAILWKNEQPQNYGYYNEGPKLPPRSVIIAIVTVAECQRIDATIPAVTPKEESTFAT